MIPYNILILPSFLLLIIYVAIVTDAAHESCTEVGFMATGGGTSKEFKICTKDASGKLSIKTLYCGENSFFSLAKKKCITRPPSPGTHNLTNLAQSPITYAFMQPPGTGASSGTPGTVQYYQHPSHSPHSFYPRRGDCPIENGKICFSCTTLLTCRNYQVVNVENCQSCDAYSNTCTNSYIRECNNNMFFYCTGFGLFPDPYFCNRFHLCLEAGKAPYNLYCPPGLIYDGYHEDCRVNSDTRAHYYMPCPSFPKCEENYQVGKMWKNAQFYYSCQTDEYGYFERFVYKCEKNYRFNGYYCDPK